MGGHNLRMVDLRNTLFSVTVNPLLGSVIRRFDKECPTDGSLLLNSLKDFLGAPVSLCPSCQRLSSRIAGPFYHLGSRFLHADKGFMQRQFLRSPYGEAWLRGFYLMMQGIEKYGVRMPFTPSGPFEIVWNFTYRCNLKCKHCYLDAGGEKRSELSTDEAKHVLDVLSKMAGVGLPALSFSGGEPLIRKDFYEVATYAKKRKCYVSLATSGTLITKDNVKKIKDAGVDYVEISVDGATRQVHDSFRGVPGAFESAIEGVKRCLEEGLDTCIATVFHRENLVELDEIIKLAKQLDVRFMHFNYVPTGRAKTYVELDPTPEERLHILETLGKELLTLYLAAKEEELNRGSSNVKVDRFFSTCPQYASVTRRLAREHGEKFMVEAHYAASKAVGNAANFLGGCGAGRLYCCIEPNGDIKPCVFFPTNKHTVLGNILNDSFEEIWDNNALLWKLRTREDLEDYIVNGQRVGCGNCSDKYICGGCRARAYSYFDMNMNAPDIGCIHNKALWEKMVAPCPPVRRTH